MAHVYINVVVLGTNAEGSPEFVRAVVLATHDDILEGNHYDRAIGLVEAQGYEGPFIAFDATDTAAKQLGASITDLFPVNIDESA